MRSFGILKAAVLAAAFVVGAAAAAEANVVINIDKKIQRMTVMVDGVKKYSWPVSTGKAGYATPSGTFWIFRMEKDYFSKEWDDAPMPHAMFFTPQGNAIHGTLETTNIGRAVSHGCVRLDPKNATTLFNLVRMNGMFATQVVITGPSPGLPPGVKKPIPPGLVKEREKRRLQQGNSIVVGDKDDWLSVSR
jgi:lipoprotein-anchoring transpeptidase ErfK/SrfK